LKTLAVGDIHTKLWIIDEVEKLIPKYDAVVFCGDYADDWGKEAPDSLATWEKLWRLQQDYPDKVKLVLGNHDFIYVNRTPSLQSGYNSITQLAINASPNKYLKDWLLSLPIILEIDGVTFSHAGIAEGWNGEQDVNSLWTDTSPIWVRPGMARYADIPQVFGHTPSETCWQVHKNIWCIDTFSTYSDGSPIGDETFLSITNGKTFRKIKTKRPNSNDTARITP
jgi:hypothetical protein